MALYPSNFNGQDRLQPGARGEIFQTDIPGHRNQGDRLNRTNMKLNVSQHDVPNIKYQFDHRLPVLFRYGFAVGFNQIVIPKGRIVAVDPNMDLVDFDMNKQHNTLTLANGGVPVVVRTSEGRYPAFSPHSPTDIVEPAVQGTQVSGIGKEWVPLNGFDGYGKQTWRGFMQSIFDAGNVTIEFFGPDAQLMAQGFKIDSETGKVVVAGTGAAADNVRPGNIPIGMMQRNEYTRDNDAYNGMMPGPVLTDALVELPWFTYKNKAEENPWGSAYGGLFPGALVKSDENGRLILSPLSVEVEVATMTMAEYEYERQQVVGQVYSVNNNLLPEGAAKWATWALEDRLNFNEFNPAVWPQNNRRGEDAINNTPYNSTNEYPGYPYDKAYKNSDLHMLASTGRLGNYNQRMNFEHQYENLGIPGLTDGKNVATRNYAPIVVGHINKSADVTKYVDMYFRTSEVDVYEMTIRVGTGTIVPCTPGAMLFNNTLRVKYADNLQGIVVIEVVDGAGFNSELGAANSLSIALGFNKRGLAGVPTFMDWDGCVGSVKILLTK